MSSIDDFRGDNHVPEGSYSFSGTTVRSEDDGPLGKMTLIHGQITSMGHEFSDYPLTKIYSSDYRTLPDLVLSGHLSPLRPLWMFYLFTVTKETRFYNDFFPKFISELEKRAFEQGSESIKRQFRKLMDL